jgi:hypothetical protein
MLYHHSFSTLLYSVPSGMLKKDKKGLELKWTHQLLVCADDVNLLGENIITIKKQKFY